MPRVILASLLLVLLAACGEDRLVERPPEPSVTETFEQERATRLDILFVIDNSRSMQEEQAALASNFARFLAYIDPDTQRVGEPNEVDYRIAITTTDANRTGGRLVTAKDAPAPDIIRPSTSYDPLDVVQRTIGNIKEGGALETGFEAAAMALERLADRTLDGEPAFLREDAWLYVVIVTDEDDASFGEVHYWYRRFESLKGRGNENTVAISAIVGDVPDGCGDVAEPGTRYAELAALTGGVHGSICTDDWGATLEQLAVSGLGLRKRFQLRDFPRDLMPPDGIGAEDFLALRVIYPCEYQDDDPHLQERVCAEVRRSCDGDEGSVVCLPYYEEEDGWTFDPRENAIVFDGDAVPGPRSTIEVEYYKRDP